MQTGRKNEAGLFAGHTPTRGSGHGVFKMSRVGSGQEISKISWVGLGRVKKRISNLAGRVGSGHSFSNLAGRVGSGQDFFHISRLTGGNKKLTARVRS